MQIPAGLTESAFSQLLGCRLQRLETGEADVALELTPQLRNRGQKLHGGAIFSLVDIAMGLAELAERGIVELRLYQPLAVAAEMRRTILRELDFTREERNLRHFAANFAGDARVVFPRTYPSLSAKRVLTMEELSGRSVAELMGVGR